jgi:hypothetical protein
VTGQGVLHIRLPLGSVELISQGTENDETISLDNRGRIISIIFSTASKQEGEKKGADPKGRKRGNFLKLCSHHYI